MRVLLLSIKKNLSVIPDLSVCLSGYEHDGVWWLYRYLIDARVREEETPSSRSTRQQQAVSTTYIIRVLDTKKSLPKNKDQKSLYLSLSYLPFPIRLQLLLSIVPISTYLGRSHVSRSQSSQSLSYKNILYSYLYTSTYLSDLE